MGAPNKMMYNMYAGALGAAATFVASKALNVGWKTATGENPPDPNDPATKFSTAAMWALASGIGIGVAQLVVNRYTARRWILDTGEVPKPKKTTVKV